MAVMTFAQTVELRHDLVCRSCAGGRGTVGRGRLGKSAVPRASRVTGHALRASITTCDTLSCVHSDSLKSKSSPSCLGTHQPWILNSRKAADGLCH